MSIRLRTAALAAFAFVASAYAQQPAAPLASQETNWSGVVAEVTEFKRKGNTLTAKVRLRNTGAAPTRAEISYAGVYLLDTGAGKKYEVLRDEKGTVIGALRPGYSDRWFEEIEPAGQRMLWVKFPAPTADVKAVTLQIEGMAPFDDLAIQDP
jgi:hypothetical protein